MTLSSELFDYDLPQRLIAQTPCSRRDHSKLLVANRAERTIKDHVFGDLPLFCRKGDILFRNNVAVLPARLRLQRPTGGNVECFLLRPTPQPDVWHCLLKPAKKMRAGSILVHDTQRIAGEVITKNSDDGSWLVRFSIPSGDSVAAMANQLGEVPLPPYIVRSKEDAYRALDVERYCTVYADASRQVAVAAPTAGLHFTPELLASLAVNGVGTRDVTLHVGMGTFKPITTETVESHPIHRETYELPLITQHALFPPLGGRRIAVGTTTVRSIEDFLSTHSGPTNDRYVADAGIFIYPPREFRGVDALITNFHQPRSTLLCLVAAFLTPGSTEGIAWLREIYEHAIARDYRFLSYGDAMLIV